MKKLCFLLFLLICFISAVFTGGVYASDSRTVKVTTLDPGGDESRDFYLVYGEVVEVIGEVNGDVYAFGGQVSIDGKVNGDVLVAGGVVNISGDISEDVRIAGGQVIVSGIVGKNLTVASGDFQLLDSARILGGLVIGSGNVSVYGPISGEVKAAAGNFNLANRVRSDVEIWGDSIRISSKGEILGDLIYHSESDINLARNSSISGSISKSVLPKYEISQNQLAPLKKLLTKFRLFFRIISFVSSLILGALLIRVFPNCLNQTCNLLKVPSLLSRKAGKVVLTGFVVLTLTPVVLILLALTVIGLPISLITLFVYLLLIYLSKIFFSLWLGRALLSKTNTNSFFHLFVGLLTFYILKSVPVINFITSLSSLVIGVGMIILGSWEFYRKLVKAKIN